MNRALSITLAAGALAFALAAGSAQAAPAGSGILGKLTSASSAASQVEKVHSSRRSCFRRCMWRTDGSYRFCKRKCHRWGW
jgi:hypothetical protein